MESMAPVGPTVAELADRYLQNLRVTAKPSAVATAESALRHIRRHLGEREGCSLTSADLTAYQAARLEHVGRAAVNKETRYLRATLRLAVEHELLDKVPLRFALLRTPRKPPTILSGDQVRALLAHAAGPMKVLLTVAALAGLRNGELAALRWRDIDLDQGVLRVAARDGWSPKSHRDRAVPLHPKAVEGLKAHRERTFTGNLDAPVFTGRRGRGWQPTHLSRAVRHVFEAAGLHRREDKSGLHQLRRTFISAVLHNGGDVETARDLAGHSSIVVTQAYVASTNEIKRRAVEALDY